MKTYLCSTLSMFLLNSLTSIFLLFSSIDIFQLDENEYWKVLWNVKMRIMLKFVISLLRLYDSVTFLSNWEIKVNRQTDRVIWPYFVLTLQTNNFCIEYAFIFSYDNILRVMFEYAFDF